MTRRRTLAGCAAGLALIVAGASRAEMRVSARPLYPGLPTGDSTILAVTVSNDAKARRVEIVGERNLASSHDDGRRKSRTRMPLDLAPGARKTVLLPLGSDSASHAFVRVTEGGADVAQVVVAIPTARQRNVVVGCLGPAPASLLLACADEIFPGQVVEIERLLLPADETTWPEVIDTILWAAPRSSDLTPAVARALERWTLAGGHLLLGATPEEPDALEVLGVGGLLPATLTRGEGLSLVVGERRGRPASDEVPGLLRSRRGFGDVTLVPADLGTTIPAPWSVLLRTDARKAAATARGRPSLTSMLAENLLPRPPLLAACALLAVFLLAAVPLDSVLSRSALSRGRRSRFGFLRYPAIVAVAVLAGFAIAGGSAGARRALRRLDVIDIDGETGAVRAATHVVAARGRSGEVELSAKDGHWSSVVSRSSPWDDWTQQLDVSFAALPQEPGRLREASITTGSWQPIGATLRWHAEGIDWRQLAVQLEGSRRWRPVECLDARYADPGAVYETFATDGTRIAGASPDEKTMAGNLVLGMVPRREAEPALADRAVLVFAQRGSRGPDIAIDGVERADLALTVYRIVLPPEATGGEEQTP